jgi:DNA transformation protein
MTETGKQTEKWSLFPVGRLLFLRRGAMQTFRSRRLSHLVNIGAKTEQLLNEVGIGTQQELQKMGPTEAWKRIKRLHPEQATLPCLYSLQGALLAVPWPHLPQEVVEELLAGVRWN